MKKIVIITISIAVIASARAESHEQSFGSLEKLIIAAFDVGYACASEGKEKRQCAKMLLDDLKDKWGL